MPPKRSRDRGDHVRPSDLASEAKRVQRALEDDRQKIFCRKARRRRYDEDIEQAKNVPREVSVVTERAHQAHADSLR